MLFVKFILKPKSSGSDAHNQIFYIHVFMDGINNL